MTYTLEHTDSGTLRITMPYRPAVIEIVGWVLAALLFLGLLAALVVTSVELAQSGELAQKWLDLCTGGGCLAVWLLIGTAYLGLSMLWFLTGQEVIEASEAGITVSHRLGRWRIPVFCRAEAIRDINVAPRGSVLYFFFTNRPGGFLGYQYGKVTVRVKRFFMQAVRFGSGLTHEEAEAVVEEIRTRFQRYR
ncbi:MAG: hypothetical protein AB8I69_22655 [Anaerolineae bacterium]|jgi:hypothetical protein